MARRGSSNEKLLLFFLVELPFYAIRLSLLLLKWTVEIAVWVFSVASELVASCSNKRERKNPVHEVLIWPGRRNNPFHVLILWLVGIWGSVLYIHISNLEPSKQYTSTPVLVPMTNNTPSSAKSMDAPIKTTDRGKSKKSIAKPSNPTANPAKRDNRGASSIQPVSASKHANSAFGDQPADTGSYLATVQRRIINEWHPPPINERMDVVVGFKLTRSGDILDVSIEQSSGNEQFDMAAKQAVLSASPLPVLPADSEDEMMTHLRFSNKS